MPHPHIVLSETEAQGSRLQDALACPHLVHANSNTLSQKNTRDVKLDRMYKVLSPWTGRSYPVVNISGKPLSSRSILPHALVRVVVKEDITH